MKRRFIKVFRSFSKKFISSPGISQVIPRIFRPFQDFSKFSKIFQLWCKYHLCFPRFFRILQKFSKFLQIFLNFPKNLPILEWFFQVSEKNFEVFSFFDNFSTISMKIFQFSPKFELLSRIKCICLGYRFFPENIEIMFQIKTF
mgnify:CR=1 FL=1